MKNLPIAGPKIAMALLAAVAIPLAAKAQTTFTLDGVEGSTSFTETEDGIMLTLSDPVQFESRFSFGLSGDGDLLDLSNPDDVGVTGFSFTFDTDVQVTSYTVNVLNGTAGGTFSLSSPDSTTSTGNTLATVGTMDVAGNFTIPAGDVGTFLTSLPDGSFPSLESITVETIPEARTWPLLALGGLGLWVAKRRRLA